jgi:uncharacterized protein YPO0396
MNDQFRMTCLQVFNWGTFSGLHEIPISERGFLIVGPSGAGKSTLLDAKPIVRGATATWSAMCVAPGRHRAIARPA